MSPSVGQLPAYERTLFLRAGRVASTGAFLLACVLGAYGCGDDDSSNDDEGRSGDGGGGGAGTGASGMGSSGDGGDGGDSGDGGDGGDEAGDGGGGTPAELDPQAPPIDPEAMADWIDERFYEDWSCEDEPTEKTDGAAEIHVHGARNRVCSNVLLAASMGPDFPMGIASVKEVYSDSGELMATLVSVKVEEDSDGGDGWYWYGGPDTEGMGLAACVGCHSAAGSDDDHPGAGDFVYFQVRDEAQLPPVGDPDAMQAWLDEALYEDWTCEEEPTEKTEGDPAIHVHMTNRVCTNDLLASTDRGDGELPAGVASVKEIFDGDERAAIDVYVKVASASDEGAGWYWYAGESAQGFGLEACTGCHSVAGADDDHPGVGDFVYFRNE